MRARPSGRVASKGAVSASAVGTSALLVDVGTRTRHPPRREFPSAPATPFRRHAARHHSSCTEAFSNPAASRLRRAASGVASVMATRFAPRPAATSPARPRPAPSSTTTRRGDGALARGVEGIRGGGVGFERHAEVASQRKSPRVYAQGQRTVDVPGTKALESLPSCLSRMGAPSARAGWVNVSSDER